jgi:mevalonate kinase
MLIGEHAVLYGYPAVICAINKRITLRLTPRQDDNIKINATTFGKYETVIAKIPTLKKCRELRFKFVIAALNHFRNVLTTGFDLFIESEFSAQLGLGSSAAVTVGTLAILYQWLHGKYALSSLYNEGVKIIRLMQQGLGSGADVAASVFGGVIAYQMEPLQIKKLCVVPNITLVYVGYKTPTIEVIAKVQALAQEAPAKFVKLYRTIGALVTSGIACIQKQDWQQLGAIFYQHFVAQQKLGVSDKVIDNIISELQQLAPVYGAKISGSGLGDCIVVLMKELIPQLSLPSMQQRQGISQINVTIDELGVCCQ